MLRRAQLVIWRKLWPELADQYDEPEADGEAAGGGVVDVATDHLLRAWVGDLGAEEDAGQRLVAHHQHRRVEGLGVSARLADQAASAPIGEGLDAADQHLAADGVDDEVDA